MCALFWVVWTLRGPWLLPVLLLLLHQLRALVYCCNAPTCPCLDSRPTAAAAAVVTDAGCAAFEHQLLL
jgi:hypothetical protein